MRVKAGKKIWPGLSRGGTRVARTVESGEKSKIRRGVAGIRRGAVKNNEDGPAAQPMKEKLLRPEPVTDTRLGEDIAGTRGVGFDLAP
ncbi:hypothetical protein GMPD_02400 [Geomonas paludis]|uniref:Uncharacterized protein n=1 Tax=Geomonas paludis TaxID=2740185 RepID=A0A6V8MQM8_9BACT|nr:hypothetical protein GMPD_02400 [Geomonas paludis]